MRCLDFIFPPSEELKLVRTLTHDHIRRLYREHPVIDIIALSDFHDVRIRALIHEAKFHYNHTAHTLLNTLVQEYLKQHQDMYDMIVPIPLSRNRERTRGYNQVYEILRAGTVPLPVPLNHKVMKRTRDTKPQTELGKTERLSNMRDAFMVTRSDAVHDARILIIDDVTTTGSTLYAARSALLPYHPKSVTLLALAH